MKHEQTIQALTLEQKCALLSGQETFKTRGIPGAGIPAIRLSDGPHGVRKQAGESDHLGLNPSEPATCFPTAVGIANSWDPALGQQIGEALGQEAAAQQVNVLLGPGLNIKRSPLCGRNFEYFSEDPYLAGKMTAGYVRGIQSQGVSACPKHFAVNSQESRRMASDSVLDERTLRELYLTGFEIAVKESQPQTLMTSYNRINGVYANEHKHLLVDILRKEWGFGGAIVTDWGGSNDHALGVKYGSTLEMPAPGGDAVRELMRAVQLGEVSEQDLDDRLEELLTLIDETQPAIQAAQPFDVEAHHALARKAAAQSAVLLKNQDGLLPLAPGAKVAVIGDFAQTPRYQGAGSSAVNVTKLDTLLDSLKDSGLEVQGYAQGYQRQGGYDQTLLSDALALAKQSDIVLFCLGLDEVKESEGLDRGDMRLSQNQLELLHDVADINPKVVALLFAGSAVEVAPWLQDCQALVYAALGGQAGASGLMDVLTGKVCPGGKLAETWPVKYEDNPTALRFPARGSTSEYREGLFVGYRYYQKVDMPVSFPFGYGLSYTSFAYSKLEVGEQSVRFAITNTGSCKGSEIAQLYIGKADSILPNPVRQLKGFAKVELEPGETKTVTIPLDDKAFRYWNVKTDRWEVEGGAYQIEVGASCQDIRLQGTANVPGTDAPDPYADLSLPGYRAGSVQSLSDAEFTALLGRPIPTGKARIDRNMTFGELNHGRSPIGWLACAIITKMLNNSIAKGHPDLNLLFIYNMPLRALAKMTSGMVSMGMVDGMVMELKGFWIIGLLRVLFEFVKNQLQNSAMEKRLNA